MTVSGTPARNRRQYSETKGGRCAALCRLRAERHGDAVERDHERGDFAQVQASCSIAPAASTPTAGTSRVPIDAAAASPREESSHGGDRPEWTGKIVSL
jgi:hypothetical protein